MTAVGSVQYRAFGLRLGNRAEDGSPGRPSGNWRTERGVSCKGTLPPCEVAAGWLGAEFRASRKTKCSGRGFAIWRRESDTLKAAHTDAIISVIEEHSHRLGEEKERWATQQARAVAEAANRAKSDFWPT